jgi:hypothetical protein
MTNKLSKHMTWLFAFGSIAAGIGSSYALAGAGQKVVAAVYFAIVAIGGFASTYLTKAKLGGAIASFLVGSGIAAVAYFALVQSIFAGSGLDKFGSLLGVIIAVVVFFETIIAGIGGAVAGAKSRDATGLQALSALAKSAR